MVQQDFNVAVVNVEVGSLELLSCQHTVRGLSWYLSASLVNYAHAREPPRVFLLRPASVMRNLKMVRWQ